MNSIVTTDLSEFGLIEKDEAGKILQTLGTSKDRTRFLDSNVNIYFNKHSGYVFASDENFNVAMLNHDDILEDFITCPNCGNEELLSEFREQCTDECCKEYADDLEI